MVGRKLMEPALKRTGQPSVRAQLEGSTTYTGGVEEYLPSLRPGGKEEPGEIQFSGRSEDSVWLSV